MSDELRPAVADPTALIFLLRQDDPGAIREAYRRTFSGDLGRVVLAHMLKDAGVGAVRGPEIPAEERGYHDGRADGAIMAMNLAGYDQPAAVVAVMTDEMKGEDDGGSRGDDGHGHGGDELEPDY